MFNERTGQGHELINVMTLNFLPNLKRLIDGRNDSWSSAVFRRISTVSDLPAADAKYHRVCYTNFKLGGDMPRCFVLESVDVTPPKKGRPKNVTQGEAFQRVIKKLEEGEGECTPLMT